MIVEPEISGVSIVLVGNFNPKIFTPDWMALHELISKDEAVDAEIAIIHPSVSQFRAAFFMLTVEEDKLHIATTQAPYVRLRDLTCRIFRSLLPHTPIGMLGINRDVHVNVGSEKVRDNIGHVLAPPGAWGAWAPRLTSGGPERHGGMTSITVQERNLDDRKRGYRQATVQPSNRIANNVGIYVQVNDHFEIDDYPTVRDAGEIISKLEDRFDASMREAEFIFDQVIGLRNA